MAGYASQCFPARNLLRFKKNTDGGAWLVAYREEQQRRFDAVLYPDSKTDLTNREKNPKRLSASTRSSASSAREEYVELNGIYLLKHMNVDDPADLAYISIIGKNLRPGRNEDFVLFDNVISIEAGENKLTLETFKTFPALRELELQVNEISSVYLSSNDFIHLESLNLSYNNITSTDMLSLGELPSLKCLHLTGNSLKQLPFETSRMFQDSKENEYIVNSKRRFAMLEILYLDENELEDMSAFSSLAGLRKLRLLNLAKNNLQCVPHLRLLDSRPTKPTNFSLKDDKYDGKAKVKKKKIEHNPGEINLQEDVRQKENSPKIEDDEIFDFKIEGLSVEKIESHEMGSLEVVAPMDLNLDLGAELNLELDTVHGERDGKEWTSDNVDEPMDFDLTGKESECPFQSLEKLDISYNDITDEEALLPLAAWPNLMEVNIWENPVTKNCKGAPPLLHYHLTKLCGITLHRKEAKKTTKPAVAPAITPAVRYHKVDDFMPPMRRKNMLMLEFESYEAALQNGSLYGQPLPPIKLDSDKTSTKGTRDSYSAPSRQTAVQFLTMSDKDRPHTVAADQFFERDETSEPAREEIEKAGREETADGVFLTQVDVADENMDNTTPQEVPQKDTTPPDPGNKNENDLFKNLTITEKRYKGYEELLQIEGPIDDLETPTEDDIRGNVKALKHALQHPLVFSDPNEKESDRETYTRHDKNRPTKSVHATKGDKVNTALEKMRKETNVIEENLGVVLQRYETDPEIRRQFPEVKKLLKVVQSKYDKVRIASLESAANAQKILKDSNKTPTKSSKTIKKDSSPKEFSKDKKNPPGNTNNASSKSVFKDSSEVSEKMARFNDLVDKRI